MVRDGVFMYCHKSPNRINPSIIQQWFEYAVFSTHYFHTFQFRKLYVFRAMHHISQQHTLPHWVPFSTTYNFEIVFDWCTPDSTILFFDTHGFQITYIQSGEDEIMVQPAIIIKKKHILTWCNIPVIYCELKPLDVPLDYRYKYIDTPQIK